MPKKAASKATGRETDSMKRKGPLHEGSSATGMTASPRLRQEACILLRTDEKGKIESVNPFGAAFFGKPETDILGGKFAQVVLPDRFDFDRRKKRFVDHFLHSHGSTETAEFETRHASGRPRRVAWSRSVVRDSRGAVVENLYLGFEVQGNLTDYGAAAPSKIRVCDPDMNRAVLERYVENSRVWAWEVNPDQKICYASPGVEKVLGFSPYELIGREAKFISPPGSKESFRKTVDAAMEAGRSHFMYESQMYRKSGELKWFETTGVIFFDEKNEFAGARGLNRDISREVAAKAELVLKEQEYRYLFDNTQVVLMTLNEDGVILNINEAGAKMHGKEPGEMIGCEVSGFLPESIGSAALEFFKRCYRQAKTQKENFVDVEPKMVRMDLPKGPSRYLRLVPKAVKVMENDQMVGILHTALDVTENQMLHKELERHQAQLQQMVNERKEEIQSLQEEILRDERLATLGRLTSTVSHEIRNPLGTINSSLYIINERLKGKDFGVASAIERGFRAVRKCDSIIEEMLDFTRTKGLEKRIVDLSAWLDRVIGDAGIPEHVSVTKRIDSGLSAPVDPMRLHRCVSCVLENSVTALQGVPDGRIRVVAGMSRGNIEISITDNGPGIPEKIRKKVFDPLYSTKQNGIGMGLPVCKQIMELHGGSVRLGSNGEDGTTVILRLPGQGTALDKAHRRG